MKYNQGCSRYKPPQTIPKTKSEGDDKIEGFKTKDIDAKGIEGYNRDLDVCLDDTMNADWYTYYFWVCAAIYSFKEQVYYM